MKLAHLIFIAGLIALVVSGSSRRHRGRLAHRREHEAEDDEVLDRHVHSRRRASDDFDDDDKSVYRSRNVRRSKRPLNKYEERRFILHDPGFGGSPPWKGSWKTMG